MSLETWKQEFYPNDPDKSLSDIDACNHSLRKWIGLRGENLKRHNVVLDNNEIYGLCLTTIEALIQVNALREARETSELLIKQLKDIKVELGLGVEHIMFQTFEDKENVFWGTENFFEIGTESCGLCVKYLETPNDNRCIKCPIYIVRGCPCDQYSARKDKYDASIMDSSPWGKAEHCYDPEPMIEAIEQALEHVTKKKLISFEIFHTKKELDDYVISQLHPIESKNKPLHAEDAVTVKQLKDYVKNLPEKDELGDDYEVWIGNKDHTSNACKSIFPLNKGDIILDIE